MPATRDTNSTASSAPVLYLALDLGASSWKPAFSVGLAQKPRLETITTLSTLSLIFEIKAAKEQGVPGRLGVPGTGSSGDAILNLHKTPSCWTSRSA